MAAAKVTKIIRPETATLYGDKVDPRLIVDHKLKRDPDGPIEILQRFWKFPTTERDITPYPLIYADLLNTGDARCLEAAEAIYEKIVDGFKR